MIEIKTENLTKVYKEVVAVDNLNFSVEHGELYALLGVNGAGKTTTIKMLSCLINPTSGDAFLENNSIVSQSQNVKQIINISPQETAVAENLTVRENLEFVAEIYGKTKVQAKADATKLISDFELGAKEKIRAKKLSGGQQRKLSIAMALISDPHILFLDEPTLGLDVISRRELWRTIKSLKGKITILLTTHYMEEAEELSDHIGIMSAGKLVAVGTAKELIEKTNAKNFEDAFVKIAGGDRI